MDKNGAQESHMNFYAQFDSLKALEKKILKSNHRFPSAVKSPAGQISQIAKLGLFGWHESLRPSKAGGKISKISFPML